MLSTVLSSIIPVAYADVPEDKSKNQSNEGAKEGSTIKEDEGEQSKEEAEEEEAEPQDFHPTLREECNISPTCVGFKKHFDHCQEKVEAGDGFKGEDCVEEIMMHCADNCLAPKLFSKLR